MIIYYYYFKLEYIFFNYHEYYYKISTDLCIILKKQLTKATDIHVNLRQKYLSFAN